MRVVSGTAGGLRLVAPEGRATRPTSERTREATFNALGSLGAVVDAAVVDLFAGSGALGIEALSRGAATATFVESDRVAVRAIEANLATCGFGARATVVPTTVERFLAGTAGRGTRFDLALVDPPYDFDGWPELLAALPAGLVAAEAPEPVAEPAGWTVLRSRRYGRAWVTLLERR